MPEPEAKRDPKTQAVSGCRASTIKVSVKELMDSTLSAVDAEYRRLKIKPVLNPCAQ
jgi:hypothetical protein